MSNKPFPRIACFHGGGSSAAIFQIQCEIIAHLLKDEFQLVFFEGPFERSAGPGVLPAFEGYAPYTSWFRNDDKGVELADGSGYESTGKDGIERVRKLMEDKGPGGEWVGVMGFSQGTRVAGGLLLDQKRRELLGLSRKTDIKLKFGVMCNGSGAPMGSDVKHNLGTKSDKLPSIVSVPTLHVHGLKDIFLPMGRHQLATYFDPNSTRLLEVNYHHAMPWMEEEVQELGNRIRRLYEDTKRIQ